MADIVVEGEWSGYTPSQRHIVYREIVSPERAARLERVKMIVYTDGTYLKLSQRQTAPGERTVEMTGYADLVAEAERSGGEVFSVKATA